ncbi:hypothetical protein Tco_0772577 [Tanacetum coccineum]|uniref:Uncharacterized protein n=1 Tax=Tanacetum coccineum TaxID=301880 RepID=A0ABQ4ZKV7_9ASTR
MSFSFYLNKALGTDDNPYVFGYWIKSFKRKKGRKAMRKEQAAEDRYWKIPICYDDARELPLQSQRFTIEETRFNSPNIGGRAS